MSPKERNMAKKYVVRVYEVELPDQRDQYDILVDAMLRDDPEISTGNYGDPPREWIEECLTLWLTYQFDHGNYNDPEAGVGDNVGEVIVTQEVADKIQNLMFPKE
jgi:hypothetical protein